MIAMVITRRNKKGTTKMCNDDHIMVKVKVAKVIKKLRACEKGTGSGLYGWTSVFEKVLI